MGLKARRKCQVCSEPATESIDGIVACDACIGRALRLLDLEHRVKDHVRHVNKAVAQFWKRQARRWDGSSKPERAEFCRLMADEARGEES